MKASTKRIISIFVSLALIGLAAFIVFNLSAPTWRRIQSIKTEIAEKEAVRRQLADLTAKAQELLSRFGDIDRQSQPIVAALPSEPKLPEVLAILGGLAGKNNLSLGQVSFEEVIGRTPSQTQDARLKAVPIKVTLNLAGRYTGFKEWLRDVEKELRLIDVQEFSVQSLTLREGEGTFNFAVSLVVYYQPKPELILTPTTKSQ
jgi:Tfp pilus assembly protein PilO